MMDFDEVLTFAKKRMNKKLFRRFLDDRVLDHSPKYHSFGILGHILLVWQKCAELSEVTGVEVRDLGLLHDIAKVESFSFAAKSVDRTGNPGTAYYGHERRSAKIASEQYGLSADDCLVISLHDWAYKPVSPEKLGVVYKSGPQAFQKWLLLCAADAFGKGSAVTQNEQRNAILERFGHLAHKAKMSTRDPILQAALCTLELNTPAAVKPIQRKEYE